MDTAKLVSRMMQTYAWMHPGQLQDSRKLKWEMTEQTLADLAKSPYAVNALVFLPDPQFFSISIDVLSTEVMDRGGVNLVIKVA